MRVVKLRGTGESLGGPGMLSPIEGDDLAYTAEIRPIGLRSYAESVSDARRQLAVVDGDGAPYILVGYSLGAAAAGDFVQYDRPKHCRGVVLVADPKRHRRQCANKGVNPNNWGIAGERFIDAVQCYSLSIPDDPISALPGNNGLRMIADRVTGLRQPLPSQWWNAGYTLDWLHRYLVGGRHTSYGVERMAGNGGRTYIEHAHSIVEGLA